MKIKANYALRQVVDTWIVLPLAEENLNLKGMLTLNNAGVLLWKALEQDCSLDQLAQVLYEEYEVTMDRAKADAEEFVQKLRAIGCLEET